MAAILNPSTSPAPWNLESERPLRPQLRLVAPLGAGPYVGGPRGADPHAAARRPLVSIAGGLGLALLVSLPPLLPPNAALYVWMVTSVTLDSALPLGQFEVVGNVSLAFFLAMALIVSGVMILKVTP